MPVVPRPRTRPVPTLAVGLVALLLCLTACGSTGSGGGRRGNASGPAGGPAAGRPAGDPLRSLIEDETLLFSEPTHPERAIATFRSLGVQQLRVYVYWAYAAPQANATHRPNVNLRDPAAYTQSYLTYLDGIVRAATAAHVAVLFTVGAPAPLWALGPGRQTSTFLASWKPDPVAYGDFMAALGTRYSGHYRPAGAGSPLPRVGLWSIWNEPNAVYLTPNAVGPNQTPYAPRLYRGLVDAAWRGLASTGHTPSSDTILIGDIAPRGNTGRGLPGNAGGLMPLTFLRALYCVSATEQPLRGGAATQLGCPAGGSPSAFRAAHPGLFGASGLADHPYSDLSAPNVEAPGSVSSGYTDFAVLPRLESILDRTLTAYGVSRRLPIFSTEYGYRTNPPTGTGLPLATAAAYMNEAEYLSWRDPRIHTFSQYLLFDPRDPSANPFDTGLETPTTPSGAPVGGTPKPIVFDAYRMPLWLPVTHTTRGGHLLVWGCARPADGPDAPAHPQVSLQFATSAHGPFRTVGTVTLDPRTQGCYFTASPTFQQSGVVRLLYGSGAHAMTSRTQSITVQ